MPFQICRGGDRMPPNLAAKPPLPTYPPPFLLPHAAIPPSIRDLLAEVLGERQLTAAPSAELPSRSSASSADLPPSPWRVTAQVHGGKVQISNNRESRVVLKAEVEIYHRGHGSAIAPRR